MEIISTSKKHKHGNNIFNIEILYPGEALGLSDSGYKTIGRIDHANFRPPGVVPMHPHKNDEILSYIRSGAILHKDSKGLRERVDTFNMMMMNAGSGLQHEESAIEEMEMLQIFMRPSKNGLEPKVQFHRFEDLISENKWRLIAGNHETAPLHLRVDTNIYDARLIEDHSMNVPVTSFEKTIHLLYCFNGVISASGQTLNKGESLVFDNEQLNIKADATSDIVLFEISNDAQYSDTGMFSGNQYR